MRDAAATGTEGEAAVRDADVREAAVREAAAREAAVREAAWRLRSTGKHWKPPRSCALITWGHR